MGYVCYMYLFKGMKYNLFSFVTYWIFNLPCRSRISIDDLSIEMEKYCIYFMSSTLNVRKLASSKTNASQFHSFS
jgi:hypothetical protein